MTSIKQNGNRCKGKAVSVKVKLLVWLPKYQAMSSVG
jgi:hypothetical protein